MHKNRSPRKGPNVHFAELKADEKESGAPRSRGLFAGLRPRASSQPGGPPAQRAEAEGEALRPRAASSGMCLEDELSCPVCCELFREPVVLRCSHSFCKACLQQFWSNKAKRECPVCRRGCSLTEPTVSLALKNLADTFQRERRGPGAAVGGLDKRSDDTPKTEERCPSHQEVLKLFCLDDEEVLCCVCQLSRRHQGHCMSPLEESAQEFRDALKKELIPLRKSLRHLYELKQECDDTTVHIKNQTRQTEKQIRNECDELRQFLQKEEEARIAALQQEEEQLLLVMKRRTEGITRDILTLSHAVIATDNEIGSNDAVFLQNYKNIKRRAQIPRQPPDMGTGMLVNVAKHVGSLKYKVWEKMMGIVQFTPVTLDPNTAYSWLSLSKDLTGVANSGARQKLPDNPERFDHFVFVLGSEGFTSGTHAWEVDVGTKEDWVLGVVKESINRKGKITGSPESGFWMISYCEGEYTAVTTPRTPLALRGALQRVRVQLDFDRGEVIFSNPLSMTPIYTFRDLFNEKMFPFFCPGANINGNNPSPLKICPVNVAVWNSASW